MPDTGVDLKTEENKMAYSYNRLWKLMIDKKINKTTLRREAGITSNAMAKMGKNQPVSIDFSRNQEKRLSEFAGLAQ